MRTLLVTPFPPYRDGIATYATQELRRLRADGAEVDVLSPVPSAARWHLPLGGPSAMVPLARRAAAYDRTLIQFGPELLFGRCRSAAERVAVWSGLAVLAARNPVELRIHEIEYGPLEQHPIERRLARLALGRARRVTVHTEAERAALNRLVGLGQRIDVIEHGRDFRPAVVRSRDVARAELGLSADHCLFVAIGFLQHHKGFDRAVDAVDRLNGLDVELHIVGSARVDHPDITGYVDRLRARCAEVASATLHDRFVSDVEFDLWLQAADAVVLPYREIWSSGVVERARLFETQIVASDLPQLRDQAPAGTIFFSDVDELTVALEKLRSATGRPIELAAEDATEDATDPPAGDRGGGSWIVEADHPDRASIQSQIAARARSTEIAGVATGGHRLGDRRPVDALLALGHLHRPEPNSARPGVAPVKRLIERLIAWRIDPLAMRLEELQRATIQAVAQLDGTGREDATPTHNERTPSS